MLDTVLRDLFLRSPCLHWFFLYYNTTFRFRQELILVLIQACFHVFSKNAVFRQPYVSHKVRQVRRTRVQNAGCTPGKSSSLS